LKKLKFYVIFVLKGGVVMPSFKERFNEALIMRDMTAAELAKKTGIGEGALSQYKKGAYKASQRNLDKMAAALNVSIPWLMGLDDESPAIPEDDKALLEEVSANPELMNLLRILKQIEPDRLAALAKLVEPML
jgi:transcriptional regulator with XRE-family HTH domain